MASTPCNPQLEITTHEIRKGKNRLNINVIRDDYLDAGTKQRGQEFFNQLTNYNSVVTVAATSGYGQLATAVMARKAGLSAYIIVSYSVPENYMTNRVRSMPNAEYIVVTRFNHLLHYINPITGLKVSIEDGYPEDPDSASTISNGLLERVLNHFTESESDMYKMSLGLHDPGYIQALVDALSVHTSYLQPKRLWLTVGSGTILTALKSLWPNTQFMCVQVGRNIDSIKRELGIDTPTYTSRYKFADSIVNKKELPPFPSLANYDAKAWSFIVKHGQDGDYFWNVAG